MRMILVGKSFPNLYAANDVEAILTFRFELPGGVVHANSMRSWYYGGDQAWTGVFPVDANTFRQLCECRKHDLAQPKRYGRVNLLNGRQYEGCKNHPKTLPDWYSSVVC